VGVGILLDDVEMPTRRRTRPPGAMNLPQGSE
jgi:hypothetical protein